MPRKKTRVKCRLPQLDFVDTPPLNTPWRPVTPSRSCLCPVTADVVSIDQIGCDWVSAHYYDASSAVLITKTKTRMIIICSRFEDTKTRIIISLKTKLK